MAAKTRQNLLLSTWDSGRVGQQELVSLMQGARAAIFAAEEDFGKPWSLKNGQAVVFTMPKVAVLRSFMMNHLIHHRAQLGMYLRLNDVPVPGLYGPSADETGM